jgi:Holliday junction resolvasome RuvABC endonuclease subunit
VTILALDLATNTGFCHGPGDTGELPTLGSFTLPSTKEDVGRFLCAYRDKLMALVSEVEPEVVVFEAPILPNTTSLITARKLQGLSGVTEMVVRDLNSIYRAAGAPEIDCREAQPASVKKALTGRGGAKKHEMVAACRAYGLRPATYTKSGEDASDEADAFGVWLYLVKHRWPQQAGRWDIMQFKAPAL